MKLLVGLGNPGPQYTHTRHNIGFMVADQLAANLSASWKLESKLKAELATAEHEGQKILLARPQTMMNLSGEAVQRIMQFYKIAPEDVWVIFDDVDVLFGRLRLRASGSSSGHQGVKSLFQHIGDGFTRVRVGISLNDRAIESSEVYVLRPFNDEERVNLPRVLASAADILQDQLALNAPEDKTFDLI